MPGLSEKIQEDPLTYRFPAFQFHDNDDVEEPIFIHCNINICSKSGSRHCSEICLPKDVELPLWKPIETASDGIPYSKYMRIRPRNITKNNKAYRRTRFPTFFA